jgi:cell division protein FtsZ
MNNDIMNFNIPKEESSIIKVIGVGGGGSNAVNHMYRQGIRGVDFVVCNTDQQALDMSPVPKKIALGSSLTEGRGAGAQAEVGRNAAIENLDDVRAVLENNTKMVFITAGMGGGTGTGAAPVIAEVAKELGILTVAIVTIPFQFEGKKRKLQADSGLEELKKHVDTVLVISNDKLREMYGNLKLSEAFDHADDVLTIAAKGIAEIITVEGYVNVDFEDVRTVMTNSGVAIMGSAITSGQDRAIKAVTQALASPLLNDNNIYGARNILLYISSGSEEVTMDEVSEITDYIQEEAGMDADVIWGNGYDEALGDQLALTIIATGFTGEKLEKVTGRENVIRHDLLGERKAPVAEVKKEIPSGLTSRPVLFNDSIKKVMDEERPQAKFQSAPSLDETPSLAAEPIIKHTLSLIDETPAPLEMPLAEEKPAIMAYMVDDNDEELNALLEAEAPEMIGVKPGEELPMYDEEDEDETLEDLQLEVAMETEEEFDVAATTDETFTMELGTEEDFAFEAEMEEEEADDDKPTINVVTTEKTLTFDFEIRKPSFDEESTVKRFSLLDEEQPAASTEQPMERVEDAPKVVARTEPFASALDTEELQRRQAERMDRLKNMNARFRSPSNLAELENVPAFKRRNVNLMDTPHSSESSVSRFELKEADETDENGKRKSGLSDGNSFLHESVD